jgi:hypothetical protein
VFLCVRLCVYLLGVQRKTEGKLFIIGEIVNAAMKGQVIMNSSDGINGNILIAE